MGEMFRVLQQHSTDQPEVHDIAVEMRAIAEDYGDRLLIGEIYLPVERLMQYYGGCHLPFNFQLIDAQWHARTLARMIADYEAALPMGGWPNWVLGNHDRPRVTAQRGEAQARVAAMLLLTLRGTPTIYYGDEIGLPDVLIPADKVQDPRELREPGIGLGRDPVRTPMPWSSEQHAGFTSGEPWLPLNPDWPVRNVEWQKEDPHSMLTLYRQLIRLRRRNEALSTGDFALVEAEGDVLAYERRQGEDRMLIALNLGNGDERFALPDWAAGGEVLMSTLADHPPAAAELALRPNEGLIIAGAR